MALVLELYPQEPYNDFYVGDTQVTLVQINHEFNFKLQVNGTAINTLHTITDKAATEIMPQVRVSAGDGADIQRHGVKVCIEAPRHIKINRGTVHRKIND